MAASFNVDSVRDAFNAQEHDRRNALRQQRTNSPTEPCDDSYPYRYIKEQWTDYLVVTTESKKGDGLAKVPYTVDDKGVVTFGDDTPIKIQYVPLSSGSSELLWENPSPAVEKLLALTIVKEHIRHNRDGSTSVIHTYNDSRNKALRGLGIGAHHAGDNRPKGLPIGRSQSIDSGSSDHSGGFSRDASHGGASSDKPGGVPSDANSKSPQQLKSLIDGLETLIANTEDKHHKQQLKLHLILLKKLLHRATPGPSLPLVKRALRG